MLYKKLNWTLMLLLLPILILGLTACSDESESEAPPAAAVEEKEAEGVEAEAPAQTEEVTAAAEKPEETIEVREATTVMAATQMIDLHDLPLPEGAEMMGQPEPGSLRYQAPVEVAKAVELYRSALTDQGWQEDVEAGHVDSASAALFFMKDDFKLSLSASDMGEGKTMVSLTNHGNIDLRALPQMADAEDVYYFPSSLGYFSPTAVAGVTEFTRRELAAQGWHEYVQPNAAMADDPERKSFSLIQNGLELSVSVGVAPAQGGKTAVQYSVTLLPLDLPLPADAAGVEFDKFPLSLSLSYTTPADFESLFDYYSQEMTTLGWVVIDDIGMMTPERATLFFGNENVPPHTLVLDLVPFDGQTLATLRNYDVDELTELNSPGVSSPAEETPTEVEAPIETEAPPMADSIGGEIPAFLTPADAQDVVYDVDSGDITYTSPSDVETVVEFYRQSLPIEGWQEDEDFAAVSEDFAFVSFDQGDDTLFIDVTLIDTGISEVAIDISLAPSLATTIAGETPPESETTASDSGPLILVEEEGVQVPSDYEYLSTMETPFALIVTFASPSEVDPLVELYETELPGQGWEFIEHSLDGDVARLYFESGDQKLSIDLRVNDGEISPELAGQTSVELSIKDPVAAAEAGILPPLGQARIMLMNAAAVDLTATINQQAFELTPIPLSTEFPEDPPSIDLPPGQYTLTINMPDGTVVNEDFEVGLDQEIAPDEVWAFILDADGMPPMQWPVY